MVVHNLGEAIGGAGDFAEAKEVFERSLAIQRQIGREDSAPSRLAYQGQRIAAAAGRTVTARRLMQSRSWSPAGPAPTIFIQLDVSACLAVIEGQNLRAIRIAGAGSSFRKTAGVATTEVWPGLVELYCTRLGRQSTRARQWRRGMRAASRPLTRLSTTC